MKSINSLIKWILFVPVCVLSVVITLISGFNPGSVGFLSTGRNGAAEIIAYSILGLFVVSFIISLFDRKTSPAHILRKNYFCGVTAVGAALAMAANAAFDLTNIINNATSISFMSVVTILLTAVAGVAMLFLGLNHFSGKNNNKGISLLYLSIPLWCSAHLIDRFLNNTATPVAAAESMDLIMFVALALFFVNVTMIHGIIVVKNSVKSAINYGLAAVVASLVYCITGLFSVINSETFAPLDLVPSITYFMIALYSLGFAAELSFKSKTVDEQIVLEAKIEEDIEKSSEYYDESEDIEDTTVEQEIYPETPDQATADDVSEDAENYSESDESSDADDDYLGEDNISFDASDEKNTEAAPSDIPEQGSAAPVFGAIRIAEDSDEEEVNEIISDERDEDIPVALDDDIDFFDDESDDESVVADELFKQAQQRDSKISEKNSDTNTTGSEEMILDGETKKINHIHKSEKHEEKPKGPTTREAIMYEDDDFILAVDTTDTNNKPVVENDDLSAFILDNVDSEDVGVTKKTYEERLDEIDRLIISIQGGENPDKE